jgi:hypothetical protein
MSEETKPRGMAIAGMVTSIVGVVLSLTPCLNWAGIIPCIIGIVLSVIALQKIKAGEAEGEGMAKAGLICGIVGIAFWIYFMLVMGALLGGAASAFDSFDY